MTGCPFCERIAKGQFDDIHGANWGETIEVVHFEPLNPVTPGHRLVVPVMHVEHAAENPTVTARTMAYAARLAREHDSANLITSIGPAATQTVRHLHIHIVPRREGDGLPLPWTFQKALTL